MVPLSSLNMPNYGLIDILMAKVQCLFGVSITVKTACDIFINGIWHKCKYAVTVAILYWTPGTEILIVTIYSLKKLVNTNTLVLIILQLQNYQIF